jgi:putative toxin-antitoxin system antitoxin component (TIGR02293 family)
VPVQIGDFQSSWDTVMVVASVHRSESTTAEQLGAELDHPNANDIWMYALEVFGDEAKSRSWMSSPLDILGGRTPEDLVSTGVAAEQRRVLEVLLRIDYGVFS